MVSAVAIGNRKDDIIASAKRLFAENGYLGVSLDAIIADTDTSKGTLYYHFDSKEDIYATALEDMVARMHEVAYDAEALAQATAQTFWPTIVAGWRRAVTHLLSHPEEMALWRGVQRQWRILPDSGPARRIRERNLQIGVAIVERGQELGCIRGDLTPMQCAELIESLDVVTDGWFFELSDEQGPEHAFDRQSPRTLDLIWRLLSPPAALWAAPPTEAAAAE